jgi:hypothetical protein
LGLGEDSALRGDLEDRSTYCAFPSSVKFSTEIPVQALEPQTDEEPNWIIGAREVEYAIWIVVPKGPSPSPIKWVLLGRIHVLEITIGVAEEPLPVAGSRIVAGGGLVIPAHGLAVHVMLRVLLAYKPRESMTVLVEERKPFDGVRM